MAVPRVGEHWKATYWPGGSGVDFVQGRVLAVEDDGEVFLRLRGGKEIYATPYGQAVHQKKKTKKKAPRAKKKAPRAKKKAKQKRPTGRRASTAGIVSLQEIEGGAPVRKYTGPCKPAPGPSRLAPSALVACSLPERRTAGWTYRDQALADRCHHHGDAKEVSRQAQREAWANGFRPQAPPRPYDPEPPGTAPRKYKEISKTKKVQRKTWNERLGRTVGETRQVPDPRKPGKLKRVQVRDEFVSEWKEECRPDLNYDPDVRAFDKIIVHFSGGKDSVACLLYVIELVLACGRIPSEVIECWHQSVDGDPRPGQGPHRSQHVFDWPITEAYIVALCNHLEVPLLFQWRVGGIMAGVFLRKGNTPHKVFCEVPHGPAPAWRDSTLPPPGVEVRKTRAGKDPRDHHRLRWPKLGGIGGGRWCSSYVKIEPYGYSFKAQDDRMHGLRVLTVTGERSEESANRATYEPREFDKVAGHGQVPRARGFSVPRYVERWRPVLYWCEIEVWAIMARWKIRPHPAYTLGFGRLSCAFCIFSSPSQLATLQETAPERFQAFVDAEHTLHKKQKETKGKGWKSGDYRKVAHTIKTVTVDGKSKPLPLAELAERGEPYQASLHQPHVLAAAWSHQLPRGWKPTTREWEDPGFMPPGAFGEDVGPT